MADIFELGIKIILALTSVFFLFFFVIGLGWAKRTPDQKRQISFSISVLYSFLFFLGGIFLLIIANFVSKYVFPPVDTFIRSIISFILHGK